MSDILCVTNRVLCRGDFLRQLEEIAAARPAGILLREKDLSEADYKELAQQVMELCAAHQVPCILHTFVGVARELGAKAIHLPLPILRTMSEEEKACFSVLGASCHSVEEAMEAQKLGCTYITAGHIFETNCKKGLPGRGLGFLKAVCQQVFLPVYAIGGIAPGNLDTVRQAGAKGACIMSGLMQCENVSAYFTALERTQEDYVHP